MSKARDAAQQPSIADDWLTAAGDLGDLGVYDSATVQQSAFARVLLLGPPKGGKTTCVASTAPRPLIINCDGANATKGAVNQGAKFLSIDAYNVMTWQKAINVALKLAEEDKISTIMVDTISLLCDTLDDEISKTLDGFDRWTKLMAELVGGIRKLCNAPAHLFVLSHMTVDHESGAGQLPAISGKSKIRIPAMLDDWILLDVKSDRVPVRQFLLGPQEHWSASGRNITRTCAIPADVGALFAELGIKP